MNFPISRSSYWKPAYVQPRTKTVADYLPHPVRDWSRVWIIAWVALAWWLGGPMVAVVVAILSLGWYRR